MTRARLLGGAALLVLLAVLPYVPSLDHPLLRDDRTLLDNPWLEREASVPEVFRHHYWHGTRHADSDAYRPLTVLTFAWNLRWLPGRGGIRGVSVALHALAVLAIAWCLRRVFALLDPPARDSGQNPERTAAAAVWSGAALFAVHPLASEAVLFAVGRADALATACGAAALALLAGAIPRTHRAGAAPAPRAGSARKRRARRRRRDADDLPDAGGGSRGRLRLALSAVLFALALLCKESAAAWLVILLALAFVLHRTGRETRIAGRALLVWSAVFAAFLLLRASVVGWVPETPPWIDNPLVRESAPARIANAILVLARYTGKMVAPVTLSAEYGYDQIRVLPLFPWALPGAMAVTSVWLVLAALVRRLSPAAWFLWLFVPAGFAVTANIAMPIGTIFAERLAYLSLAGACGLAGLLIRRVPMPRNARRAALLLLLALGAARIVDRGRDFRSAATLNEATLAASPRAVKALANVGRNQLRSGRLDEARALFERALAIWPDYPGVLARLAEVHERRGDPRMAEEYRRRAREAYARWKSGE